MLLPKRKNRSQQRADKSPPSCPIGAFRCEFKAESEAPFPVLTDFDNGYALSLNLAFWVGQEMQDLMSSAGWNVARWQGTDTWLLPIPATFVVGTDREVKARFIDPDYRKRMTIAPRTTSRRQGRCKV
jgi:peroxiredoxin